MGVSIYPDPTNNHAHIQTHGTEKRKGERTRETTATNGDEGQDRIKFRKEGGTEQRKNANSAEVLTVTLVSSSPSVVEMEKYVFYPAQNVYFMHLYGLKLLFFTSNGRRIFLQAAVVHWSLR